MRLEVSKSDNAPEQIHETALLVPLCIIGKIVEVGDGRLSAASENAVQKLVAIQ